MYEIKVTSEFSAAHRLRAYQGKCEKLHGHNWKVELALSKEYLDKTGIAVDFRTLKKELEKIIEILDHSYLNDLNYFKKINPTSENIAKFIFDGLKKRKVPIDSVSVWESDSSCATYSE